MKTVYPSKFCSKLFCLIPACRSCPLHFRKSSTIAMRKPGKGDNIIPKACRPIALLGTLGKALEVVLATRLSFLAKTHSFLPDIHFHRRRGGFIAQAFTEQIYKSWNQGKAATALFHEVLGAFDNI